MKIAVHIPFYNQSPEETQRPLNKNKIFFLKKSLLSLESLKIRTDIYIHTHNNYLDDKNIKHKIIKHKLNNDELKKGYLTWVVRKFMEKQANDYDYFMYKEHDIIFNQKNFNYWKKYNSILKQHDFNTGFLVLEKGNKKYYSIHSQEKLKEYIDINNTRFFVVNFPYYCCWIYDRSEFKKFINTKWWKFNWNGKNYLTFYGITEMSAIGWHGLNMDRYKLTLIPKINKFVDEGCFLIHSTNNYFYRRKHMMLSGRYVCKFSKNDLVGNKLFKYRYITKIDKFILKLKFCLRTILRLYK